MEYIAIQLSDLSSNGFDRATTMKLFSGVGGQRILTMIDNGASHCFLSETVAAKISLYIIKFLDIQVILEDGSGIDIQGKCKVVHLTLGRHIFLIDCYVFLLRLIW